MKNIIHVKMKQAIVYVADKLTEQTYLFALTANGNLFLWKHCTCSNGYWQSIKYKFLHQLIQHIIEKFRKCSKTPQIPRKIWCCWILLR